MSAHNLFVQTFGWEPHSIWQGPGRVNLIGEHTDYNDGYVLPFAIDRAATAAFRLRDDRRIRLASTFDPRMRESSLDQLDHGRFEGWAAYPLGIAWVAREFGADLRTLPGFDLAVHSTVPVGAGLSSSAALEMAVATALNDQWNLGLRPMELARLGQRAENMVVGAPTGIMDQAASVLGREHSAVFLDCRTFDTHPIFMGLAAQDLALLVVDTQVEHAHATGGYKERRQTCERAALALGVSALRDLSRDDLPRAERLLDPMSYRRVKHIVTENERVLDSVLALRNSHFALLGKIMSDSHDSMRDDFEISVPELDTAVDVAMLHGALGARMTGGGFGGSAIALINRSDEADIVQAVRTRFDAEGFGAPQTFLVQPSKGAGRLS